jgi:trk system potassium uptake protein TrkH
VREPRAGSIPYNLDMMKAILSYLFVSLLVIMPPGDDCSSALSLPDFPAAITAAIAAFANIGPSLRRRMARSLWHGRPIRNSSHLRKVVMIVTMILGRLEVLVVLAAFNLSYWRS